MNNEYVIYTDATADIPFETARQNDIHVIPMQVEQGGKNYVYDPSHEGLDPAEFYSKLRDGIDATTSQINAYTFEQIFAPALEEGKDVLYIAFSSALSGTYQAAVLAAESLKGKYPDNKVIAVDSLAASLGEGLLVYTAAQQKKDGMGIDELESWLIANRNNLCHWFTVSDLMLLKRGGRVSAAGAVMGTALKIKPVLHVDDVGRLIMMSKVQGRKHSLKELVKEMKATYIKPDGHINEVCFIGHGDSLKDAYYVRDLVKSEFGVNNFVIDYIGPVIGAHSGPDTIALFFFGIHK